MKINKLIIITLTVCLLLACKSSKVDKRLNDDEFFKIEVVQNGKVIEKENEIIWLEKKPFKYRVMLIKTKDVYVSNSWGTHYFDYPDTENIFKCDEITAYGINESCRFFPAKVGVEDTFNSRKDIFVGDQTYHGLWFYDETMDWHRMDEGVIVKDGIVNAEVTVENIFDLDKRDEGKYSESEYAYPIENISENIYVVFATSRYEEGKKYLEELQREKFILKFK